MLWTVLRSECSRTKGARVLNTKEQGELLLALHSEKKGTKTRLCKGFRENGVKKYREHGAKKTREQGAKESNIGSRRFWVLSVGYQNSTPRGTIFVPFFLSVCLHVV